jgi:hypothetical protein
MAKATSRKHATHGKKARAHHPAKAHAHKASASKPVVAASEPEIVEEEFSSRVETSRISDEDLDDDLGIYSASRGENAG